MPLIIQSLHNDNLQKIVLLSPRVSDITLGIIEKIDGGAIENSEDVAAALIRNSFDLIGATPSSIDSL